LFDNFSSPRYLYTVLDKQASEFLLAIWLESSNNDKGKCQLQYISGPTASLRLESTRRFK